MAGRSDRILGCLLAATVALVLLALPATAPAAQTFHASPSGSGDCSAGSPCELAEALALALAGDTVTMAGDKGTYGTHAAPLTTEINVHNGVTLQGATGQPMPQIYSDVPALPAVRLESGTVSNLTVHHLGSRSAITGAGTIERVLALGGSGVGCEIAGTTTIVSSVCAGVSGIFSNVGEPQSLTLRNATIIGSDTGMLARTTAGAFQITAVNTILQGVDKDILAGEAGPTALVSVDLHHSNYETVMTEAGASVTAAGSGTNQTAAPLFANAATGEYAQLPDSPTVDAGVNEAANGTLDLAANARTLPGRITCDPPTPAIADIGAYELVPGGPICAPPPGPAPDPTPGPAPIALTAPPTTAILKATVNGSSATFRFQGANATRFECKLDRKPFRACRSPKTYRHLKPGKHRFAVKAVGPVGSDQSPAVRKFETPKQRSGSRPAPRGVGEHDE